MLWLTRNPSIERVRPRWEGLSFLRSLRHGARVLPHSAPRKAYHSTGRPVRTQDACADFGVPYRAAGMEATMAPKSGRTCKLLAAASWCRLSAGENHVQVQTSFVVAASSGMDFAGEGAIRAHGPQTDCRCRRQTAPSSCYKPGQLDGARGLYVAVPGRPAIS